MSFALQQLSMATNTDKFYKIQLLSNSGGEYFVAQHWGRTGTKGQRQQQGPMSLDEGVKAFEKKFREKAGAPFAQRNTYVAKDNKYMFKKKDYARVSNGKIMWQYFMNDNVDGKTEASKPFVLRNSKLSNLSEPTPFFFTFLQGWYNYFAGLPFPKPFVSRV